MYRTGYRDFNKKFRDLTELEMVEFLKEQGFFLGGSRSKFEQFERQRLSYLAVPDLDWTGVENSDWDFSFEDGDYDMRSKIITKGFELQEISGEHIDLYGDDSFLRLYKHPKYNIDIIERILFGDYKKVWNRITPDFYHKHLWKSAPHRDKDKVGEHKEFIRDYLNQALRMV